MCFESTAAEDIHASADGVFCSAEAVCVQEQGWNPAFENGAQGFGSFSFGGCGVAIHPRKAAAQWQILHFITSDDF